jgi:hypothetical protein
LFLLSPRQSNVKHAMTQGNLPPGLYAILPSWIGVCLNVLVL